MLSKIKFQLEIKFTFLAKIRSRSVTFSPTTDHNTHPPIHKTRQRQLPAEELISFGIANGENFILRQCHLFVGAISKIVKGDDGCWWCNLEISLVAL